MVKIVYGLLVCLSLLACHSSPFPPSGVDLAFANYEQLYKDKLQYQQACRDSSVVLNKTIIRANKALASPLFSVTHKTGLSASGNKHDYFTIAPYFWPNPETPDGLPYVRKDGEINPEARTAYTDYNEAEAFFSTVDVLGRAFFLSEKEEYAQKAAQLIKAWFLDTATMMNPHLDYAQGIPGINDGRCFGIIEFGALSKVVTSIELMKYGGVLDAELEQAFNQWISSFLHWLRYSKLGMEEALRMNNHGTYYDKLLCGLLWYLDREVEVKQYLETVVKARIDQQISPDGKQLHELARTKAFSYSAMNLRGFMALVAYGQRLGVDLWAYHSPSGASLKKAHLFLADYLKDRRPWDYQQITHGDYYAAFAKQLIQVGNTMSEPDFVAIGEAYLAGVE